MAVWYVQDDGTIWVPIDTAASNDALSKAGTPSSFAELFSRQDRLLRYRIRPVTLWQAAARGLSARDVLTCLRSHTGHPLPLGVQKMIVREMGKWGRLRLEADGDGMRLTGDDELLRQARSVLRKAGNVGGSDLRLRRETRGYVKQMLAAHGLPVLDDVGVEEGLSVEIEWREGTQLRPYQRDAVEAFLDAGGSGVVVLPCGAGKTFVGIGVLVALKQSTLIIAPSETSAGQWLDTLHRFTTVRPDVAGLYRPDRPLCPVTVTTYPRVAARTRRGVHTHLERLAQGRWGLVIYDEVQMLPAPVFRLTAELQSARRLGLTATLVREDGAETDVFSLIGAKCFDLPWRILEREGYLSALRCIELRVPLPPPLRSAYERAGPREQHRIAAINPKKLECALALAQRHRGQGILILGHYLESLRALSTATGWPLICGEMPQRERAVWFQKFRDGRQDVLILSRVANVAVDVPNASVGIQLSGLFGSRQEEAQRVGRLLRPKDGRGAIFYTLVSAATVEERQALRRQMFLCEQGYDYEIQYADDRQAEEVSG